MSGDEVHGVVLAGTHHWRRSSFERLAVRPLVPVALAPLLSYSLRWLRAGGVASATVCANGTTTAIRTAFGDGRELDIELGYYRDGTPRGPAGCVRDAGKGSPSPTLVVTDGTAIPTVDLDELLAAHRASGAAMTAVVHREREAAAPSTPSGVYVVERRVLEHVAANGFQDIKENLIPRLRRAGERVEAYMSGRFCPHVFDARTYLAVNQWMLRQLARADAPGGGILHPGAFVEPGARLVGPVQLGPGARVAAGATIVGPTTIGAESIVGRDALVARSVVWSRCTLGARSVVHGCVLGDDVVVPRGAGLFNVVRSAPEAAPHPTGIPLGAPHLRSVPMSCPVG